MGNGNSIMVKFSEFTSTLNNLNAVDLYKLVMEMSGKQDMLQVLKNQDFTNLAGTINKVHEKLKMPGFNTKNTPKQDRDLYEYIKAVTDVDINKEFEAFSSSVKDESLKAPLTKSMESIGSMAIRYRFYLYKYIQLNLFFIAFCMQIKNVFSDYTLQVSQKIVEREALQDEALKKYMEMVNTIVRMGDVDESDVEQLSQLGNLTKTGLSESLEKLKKEIEDYNKDTIKGLLDVVLTQNNDAREHAEQILKSNSSKRNRT